MAVVFPMIAEKVVGEFFLLKRQVWKLLDEKYEIRPTEGNFMLLICFISKLDAVVDIK